MSDQTMQDFIAHTLARLDALEQRGPEVLRGRAVSFHGDQPVRSGISITPPEQWNTFWRNPAPFQAQAPQPSPTADGLCWTWMGAASQYARTLFGQSPLMQPPWRVSLTIETSVQVLLEVSMLVGDTGTTDFFQPNVYVLTGPSQTVPVGTSTLSLLFNRPADLTNAAMQPFVTLTPASAATGQTCLRDVRWEVLASTTAQPSKVWTPLPMVNGWRPYGQGYADPSFLKDSNGFVHLQGLAASGTQIQIATMPPGFRPGGRLIFPTVMNPNVIGRIDIGADGGIVQTTLQGAWQSLDGIVYLAEK